MNSRNVKFICLILAVLSCLVFTSCIEGETLDTNTRIMDENGNPYGVKEIDNKMRVSAMPYLYDIAEGNVTGHMSWSKTGYNPNVGTSEETVWSYSTQYVYPTSAMQMEVVSSDNTQDKAGGTGALAVTITYLDGSYNEHSEVVELNGTTAVPTSHVNLYRINSFRCTNVGTNGAPIGNITLRGVGGGTVYSYMLAGYTRARNIVYTVPEGYDLYITSVMWSCSEATKGVRFINKVNYDNISSAPRTFFVPYHEATLYNTALYRPFEIPTHFPEHIDIKISVISTQAGAVADVSLRGWLETN